MNILHSLASQYADRIAVVEGQQSISYDALLEASLRRAQEFASQGITQGQIVIVRTSQSIDYLTTYFALHELGAIVAPVEHDIPEEALSALQKRTAAKAPRPAADILFTTGTTGQPKGVVVSEEAIIADAENLIEAQGFHEGLQFIICGPLNHAGCWTKVYPTLMTGGTLHLLEGLKDVNLFFDTIEQCDGPCAAFLVPTSIRIMLQFSRKRMTDNASRIEFIETGAAAIAASDLNLLRETLPDSRLYNTYASTETGVVTTYNFGHRSDGSISLTDPTCLGTPMRHARLRIDDGVVVCSGRQIMSGYIEAFLQGEASPAEIRTTDLGMIDENGCLHLSGRLSDVINVGGLKVSPTEIEDAALSMPGIRDCICLPAPHPIMGSVPRLLVVMQEGHEFQKRQIALYLKARLENYKVPLFYEQVDSIRRTFNGKLDRKAYL